MYIGSIRHMYAKEEALEGTEQIITQIYTDFTQFMYNYRWPDGSPAITFQSNKRRQIPTPEILTNQQGAVQSHPCAK
jgi:hypothetical protein